MRHKNGCRHKWSIAAFTICFFYICTLMICNISSTQAGKGFTVFARIMGESTTIDNVNVELRSNNGPVLITKTTSNNGWVVFKNLDIKEYSIRAYKGGRLLTPSKSMLSLDQTSNGRTLVTFYTGEKLSAEAINIPFEDEWANSAHADSEAEAFNHWNEDGEIPTTCAKCHSTPGIQDFLGDDGTTAQQVDYPAELGTVIECDACHNKTARELDFVTFPSGETITDLGHESICMTCHQGRSSSPDVDSAIEEALVESDDAISEDLGFINIHYYAAAATKYGTFAMGGYQYDGKSYDAFFKHTEEVSTCIECHSPHSLELDIELCGTCHDNVLEKSDIYNIRMNGSLVDYDGDGNMKEGIFYELETLRNLLYSGIQTYAREVVGTPIIYNGQTYPYFFIDTNGNGVADDGEVSYGNKYDTWTARLLKAAYNGQVSLKDPGAFAHGGKYIIQLLYDSLEDLNTALVNSIDLSGLSRDDAGHFAGAEEAFRHWDEDGEVPGSCARCHGEGGLATYLKEGVNISAPFQNGMLCSTCHDDLTDFGSRRSADEVTFPSGLTATLDNDSNLCMTCHQGRASMYDVDSDIKDAEVADDDTVSEDLGFINIHYFAAAATKFGTMVKGGYQYDDKSYDAFFMHTEDVSACNDCHNTHSLELKIDLCGTCHTNVLDKSDIYDIRMNGSLVDYDGDGNITEGIFYELEAIRNKLFEGMQAYAYELIGIPIVYDSHTYPYFFIDTNGNSVADDDEASYGNKYASWTARLVKAAYNYQVSLKDPGAFAHGGKYIIQLMYDSLEDLNTVLTNDIDISGLNRDDEGHFAGPEEAFRHWDEDGEVSGSCAKCHGGGGLATYIENGENESTPVQNGMLCSTCHDDLTNFSSRRSVDEVTFPSGMTATFNSDSNLCILCHQGRESKYSVDEDIAESAGPYSFVNIHYYPVGAILFGSDVAGGYEFDGKKYAGQNKFRGHEGAFNECVECHMGVDAEKANKSHNVTSPNKANCVDCHGMDVSQPNPGFNLETFKFENIRPNNVPDYNGNGNLREPLHDEIEGLETTLLAAIQQYASVTLDLPIVYDDHTYPYFFNDSDADGITDEGEVSYGNRYTDFDANLLKASYNYQTSKKEPSGYIHNSRYMAQLLVDSIEALLGYDVPAFRWR